VCRAARSRASERFVKGPPDHPASFARAESFFVLLSLKNAMKNAPLFSVVSLPRRAKKPLVIAIASSNQHRFHIAKKRLNPFIRYDILTPPLEKMFRAAFYSSRKRLPAP